jgi:hypothetical protein
MAAAEAGARARGAAHTLLSTHRFPTPDFDKRLGFEAVGAIKDYPEGYRHILMRKRLE